MNILCVDDEVEITKALELYLGRFFHIITANTPLEALTMLENKDSSIDVVLSDYIMPDMDGCTLLNHVKNLNPQIKRVIVSGYSNDEDIQKNLDSKTVERVFHKPWNAKELLAYLRELESEISN